MDFLLIHHSRNGIRVSHIDDSLLYIGYSTREAVTKFRRKYGLVGKCLQVIETHESRFNKKEH